MFTRAGFFFILKAPEVLFCIYICKEREVAFLALPRKSLCQKYRSHSVSTVIRTDCTKESCVMNSGALFNETECRSAHRNSSWGINSIHAVGGLPMYDLFVLILWLSISGSFACSGIAKLASVWAFQKNYKDSVSSSLHLVWEDWYFQLRILLCFLVLKHIWVIQAMV